jgi:hypothetical protein
MGGKREEYIEWLDKLINAMSRIGQDPVKDKIPLKHITQSWAKDDIKDHIGPPEAFNEMIRDLILDPNLEGRMTDEEGADRWAKEMSSDLDYVLTEKTEGQSAARVKKAPGQGLLALYSVQKWFTQTTGPMLQEDMKKVMSPKPVTRDELILQEVEEWERSVERIGKYGKDYTIQAIHKLNALEILMNNKKEVFEAIERSLKQGTHEERCVELITKIKQYGLKRRQDSMTKKGENDPMDISAVNSGDVYGKGGGWSTAAFHGSQEEEWMPTYSVDFVNKGRGGGKGKGGGKD